MPRSSNIGTKLLRDFQFKKHSIPAGRSANVGALQLCAPTNVQIIWDNLFFGSP